MIQNIIQENIFRQIFQDHSIKIDVYLRASKTKHENYDKFRNVGYTQTYQNPIPVQALTKAVAANSLIIREIGLTESGALQLIVNDDDLEAIKLAEKLIINGVEYTPRIKALGNRFQSEKRPFNFTKVIVFILNK